MESPYDPINVRKGRFLWMDDLSRKKYLDVLHRKIAEGYFFSDAIISNIVDDIAPTLGETAINDLTPG